MSVNNDERQLCTRPDFAQLPSPLSIPTVWHRYYSYPVSSEEGASPVVSVVACDSAKHAEF